MKNREIKFAIYHIGNITERKKLVGYERIINNKWEWMCIELNPDKGERWTTGGYPTINDKCIRCQFTGLLDKNEKEIYEGYICNDSESDNIYVVEWNQSEMRFVFSNTDEDYDFEFVQRHVE